jgi:tetratricopeptide (TPR) repeat protein
MVVRYLYGLLGNADWARERSGQAIAVARETDNPFDMATAQCMTSLLYVMLPDPKQAESAASQALDISEKNSFPFYAAKSCISLGWARANLGNPDEGVALTNEGLTTYTKTGARASVTRYLTELAQAQALKGATADAIASLEAALQVNPNDPQHRPETLRLRGELRLQQGQAEPAQADFREAIALAQKMSAKAWELRTSLSLARMLRSRGDTASGRTLLSPIYSSFKEGSDTLDLVEAKASMTV